MWKSTSWGTTPLAVEAQEADVALWKEHMAAGNKAYQEGRYAEAEQSWQAALKEAEKFGPEDPRLATTLNNLAELYRTQGQYADAEPLVQRALEPPALLMYDGYDQPKRCRGDPLVC